MSIRKSGPGEFKPIGVKQEPVVEETKKPSNPKDIIGSLKAPLHHISGFVLIEVGHHMASRKVSTIGDIPPVVLYEIGLAMFDGGIKYGSHNYRAAGVRASIYFDATCRHAAAMISGEDFDPDSGLYHPVKICSSLTVLLDGMMNDMWYDDRPWKATKSLEKVSLNFPGVLDAIMESPDSIVTHGTFYASFMTYLCMWWEGLNYTYDGGDQYNTLLIALAIAIRWAEYCKIPQASDQACVNLRLVDDRKKHPLNFKEYETRTKAIGVFYEGRKIEEPYLEACKREVPNG